MKAALVFPTAQKSHKEEGSLGTEGQGARWRPVVHSLATRCQARSLIRQTFNFFLGPIRISMVIIFPVLSQETNEMTCDKVLGQKL